MDLIRVSNGDQEISGLVESRMYSQLGMFVCDGSGSMSDLALNGMRKDTCVAVATSEVLGRFQASTKRENFCFTVVTFDNQARQTMPVTAAMDVDLYADYTPQPVARGGTFIGSGLEIAGSIANEFLNTDEGVPKSVVIVILSDGMDTNGSDTETLRIARRLKENPKVTICACYFAQRGEHNPDAEQHLRNIASNPATCYKTVYDPETIRSFFIASLSGGLRR